MATPDTVYMSFGVEGVTGPTTPNQIMGRVVEYLLR
jgi:hypothetical protein